MIARSSVGCRYLPFSGLKNSVLIVTEGRPQRSRPITSADPVLCFTQHGANRGFERSTNDWESIVDDNNVDVLVNLAGNDAHAAPSIAGLRQGKHALCEKPIATDPAEVAAMVEAAEASASISVVGYNYRFVPALQLMRGLLDDGRLGRLRAINNVVRTGLGGDCCHAGGLEVRRCTRRKYHV